jgi:hypothetical protein
MMAEWGRPSNSGSENPFVSLVKWLMLWLSEALQKLTAFSDIKIKTGYSIFMVWE